MYQNAEFESSTYIERRTTKILEYNAWNEADDAEAVLGYLVNVCYSGHIVMDQLQSSNTN